jgi:hypothetical protein
MRRLRLKMMSHFDPGLQASAPINIEVNCSHWLQRARSTSCGGGRFLLSTALQIITKPENWQASWMQSQRQSSMRNAVWEKTGSCGTKSQRAS